jgi:hypothetical protein
MVSHSLLFYLLALKYFMELLIEFLNICLLQTVSLSQCCPHFVMKHSVTILPQLRETKFRTHAKNR